LVALCLAINLFVGFLPERLSDRLPFSVFRPGLLTVPDKTADGVGILIGANYPVLDRGDKSEIERLVRCIKDNSEPGDRVFVASGSKFLHSDTILNSLRLMSASMETGDLKVLDSPILDCRDALPLEAWLTASIIVVASPAVSLYKSENATILRLTEACFGKDRWEIVGDFQELKDRYRLDGGTMVSVFKRIRPTTPAVAVRTLETMAKSMPISPGGQPEWISTDETYTPQDLLKRSSIHVGISGDTIEPAHFLLSSRPLEKGAMIRGKIEAADAASLAIGLILMDRSGNRLDGQQTRLQSQDGAGSMAESSVVDKSISFTCTEDSAYAVIYVVGTAPGNGQSEGAANENLPIVKQLSISR
jgi:hypothetical protein